MFQNWYYCCHLVEYPIISRPSRCCYYRSYYTLLHIFLDLQLFFASFYASFQALAQFLLALHVHQCLEPPRDLTPSVLSLSLPTREPYLNSHTITLISLPSHAHLTQLSVRELSSRDPSFSQRILKIKTKNQNLLLMVL